MATQAEVIDLVITKQVAVPDAAKRLGITTSGVYGHLRRAGYGRAARGGRRRTPRMAAPQPLAAPTHEHEAPSIPSRPQQSTNTDDLANDAVTDIRMRISDTVEGLESRISVKRAEVEALETQHRVLYSSLKSLIDLSQA